jgi:hypothetical protein
MAATAGNGPLLLHKSSYVRHIPVGLTGNNAPSKQILFSCNKGDYHLKNNPMMRQDSLPSLPHHRSVLRAIDWLIAREKYICLLRPSSSINPTHMLSKLELMWGDRGQFLVAAFMVVMWLLSSNRLENLSQRK